jgi:4'-phosphopantetheinyl transferase
MAAAPHWIVARAAVRIVLGERLGLVAGNVEIATGPHGKPELPGATLRFNHSHSGDRALVALAEGVEVGIDVERTGRRSTAIERTLTAGERAAIEGVEDRHTELLRIWCRKEALAKAIGGGLGWAPEEFDTSDPAGHTLVDLDVGAGYVGALAVAGKVAGVTHHRVVF